MAAADYRWKPSLFEDRVLKPNDEPLRLLDVIYMALNDLLDTLLLLNRKKALVYEERRLTHFGGSDVMNTVKERLWLLECQKEVLESENELLRCLGEFDTGMNTLLESLRFLELQKKVLEYENRLLTHFGGSDMAFEGIRPYERTLPPDYQNTLEERLLCLERENEVLVYENKLLRQFGGSDLVNTVKERLWFLECQTKVLEAENELLRCLGGFDTPPDITFPAHPEFPERYTTAQDYQYVASDFYRMMEFSRAANARLYRLRRLIFEQNRINAHFRMQVEHLVRVSYDGRSFTAVPNYCQEKAEAFQRLLDNKARKADYIDRRVLQSRGQDKGRSRKRNSSLTLSSPQRKVSKKSPSSENEGVNTDISDEALSEVSNYIGQEWQQIAIESLNLKKYQLHKIKEDNKTFWEKVFGMFEMWRKQNPGQASARNLFEKLKCRQDVEQEVLLTLQKYL